MQMRSWDVEITPVRSWWNLDLGELFRYRDLVRLMVRRDIVAQYKQTVLGPLWHVIQPLITTFTFAVVFGRAAGLAPTHVPSILFYLSGVVAWSFFSGVITRTSRTFLANANIMSKVYFPRLVVPISTTVSSLVSFGIQLVTFLAIYGWYLARGGSSGWGPSTALFLAPALVLLMAFLALGIGVLVSAMTTKYRDISFLVGFGLQLLMYASPVIMPLDRVQSIPILYTVFKLNPMTPIIETFRTMFFGGMVDWSGLGYATGVTGVIMLVALIAFHRVEQYFADIV